MRSAIPPAVALRIRDRICSLRKRFGSSVSLILIALVTLGSDCDLPTACSNWDVESKPVKEIQPDGSVKEVETWFLRRKSGGGRTYFKKRKPEETEHDLCVLANEARANAKPVGGSRERAATQAEPFSVFDQYASDILIRDLDGDGNDDIILAFEGADTLTVVRTVRTNFLPAVKFPAGINPVVIRAADINRDGKLDLLTANFGTLTGNDYVGGDVSLLLGNGDGTFQTPISVAAGKVPRDLGIGDFNEDGKLDLVIADTPYTSGHQLLLRLGNGDGTFQPATVIETQNADSLAVVDLNPAVDDHDDIVTNGSILLGRGDGTFAPAVDLPLGLDIKLDVVKVGDLNGDSKPDVIVASSQSQVVSIFLGKGDGTLRPPHHYPLDGPAGKIEIKNLNGDGVVDILVSNGESGGARLIGNGDGTFQAPELYASVLNVSANRGAYDAVVADFTGDGVPDIVVVNGFYSDGGAVLLKGLGSGRFAPAVPIPGPAGTRVTAGDWNGDTRQDLAFTLDGDGVAKPRLIIALGNGDGTFAPSTSFDLSGGRALAQFFCATAFVNADKAPDFLVANPANGDVAVFLGDGKGGFGAQPSVPIGVSPNGIVSGDLNGDGKLDMVVTYQGKINAFDGGVKVALGNGDGTFRTPQTLRSNVAPNSIAMADFNGDGKLDFAIALEVHQFDWDVEIFLGNGDGTFAAPKALGLTEDLISGVVVADVDLDGKPDLAVSEGSSRVLGFRGNGDGTFERALSAVKGGLRGGQMLATDLDLDGLPDMACALGNGFVSVYRNPLADAGPSLSILRAVGKIELTWPSIFKGFSLKEADSLSNPILWQAPTNAVNLVNDRFHAVIETLKKARFFRLEKSQ